MKHVFVILETVNGFVDRSNGIIYHRRGTLRARICQLALHRSDLHILQP